MVKDTGVPAGYKQTEVGVIPEDWEVKKLEAIADIDPENLNNSTNPEYSFQYISLEDVDYGTLRNTTELLFKNAPSRARRKIRKDDILLSTVRPNLKSHLLIKKEISNWICSTGFSVVRCKDNIAHSGFVFNHFFSSVIDRQIETLITGSNYPAINSKDVKSLLIPLPPLPEQQAIASALSDVDALITALEQLITKKRNIKQGAMQQLLTGKKRLPRFSGKWEVKTLENITTEIGDGLHSTPQYVQSSDFFFVNGNNFVDNSIKITENTMCVSENEYNRHKKKLNQQTILLSINGTIGNIAFFNDEKVILGKSAAYINVNNSTNRTFIFYLLQSSNIKNYFEDELTGTTIRNLSLKTIRNTPILFPLPPEQQAIATILSDMDAEIEALEQKRDKYRALKQGMMQELLTGKMRFIKENKA